MIRHPIIELDLANLRDANLEAVDALATLQLVAQRRGMRILLRGVPPALGDLLCLCGLEQVLGVGSLGVGPAGGVEVGGQPEEREEPLGVEEERDPGDPVARQVDDLE